MTFQGEIKRDLRIAALATIVIGGLSIALASKGILAFKLSSYLANLVIFCGIGLVGLIAVGLKIGIFDRRSEPLKRIDAWVSNPSTVPRLLGSFIVLTCLIAFMPTFSAMKSAIPMFNGYSWDSAFIDMDRLIHGGDAWKLMQPVLGFPFITSVLSAVYHIWLLLLYAVALFFAFNHKQPALRQRYFISYFLAWTIVGTILAVVFSSVGPCFVHPILGRDDFVAQMEYLRNANEQYPVAVLQVQEMLLARYQDADSGLGSGITAMPSMHVSQAMLFFLAMRHVSRIAGWVFGVFLVLIMIGSVHLAYHYAVDGYFAMIVTVAIWKVAGWWTERDQSRVTA